MPLLQLVMNEKEFDVYGDDEADSVHLSLIVAANMNGAQLLITGMKKDSYSVPQHIEWLRTSLSSNDKIRIIPIKELGIEKQSGDIEIIQGESNHISKSSIDEQGKVNQFKDGGILFDINYFDFYQSKLTMSEDYVIEFNISCHKSSDKARVEIASYFENTADISQSSHVTELEYNKWVELSFKLC